MASTSKCRCSFFCVTLTSLLILVPAIGLYVTLDDLFLAIVKKQTVLEPDGLVTKQWQNPEVPVYVYFYFYNLLNGDEVKSGKKPAFEQVGPFVYREHRDKYDIKFLYDDVVVQYRMDHYFTPELNMSISDPSNYSITTLNVPLAIVLGAESRLSSQLLRDIIEIIAEGAGEQDLFLTKTVDELLWGYDDPIFSAVHKFEPSIPAQFSLQQQNITDDANLWSRVFTGKGDPTLVARYTHWHEMMELPYWGSPAANAINGTEGYLFHPNVQKDEKLYAYIDNLFRSGYFTFNNTATVEDIDVLRFVIPGYELLNSTTNPNNVPFFMDGPGGMMNMSALNPLHPPIFMSKPHFLDAPQYIIDSVVGLQPVRTKHDSYLDLHALTGGVLRAHKRMQVNVLIEPQKNLIYDTSLLRETYFPVMFVDETATITPSLASEFRNRVMMPMNVATISILALIILSSGGLLTGTIVLLYRRRGTRRSRYADQDRRPAASLNDGGAVDETSALLQ